MLPIWNEKEEYVYLPFLAKWQIWKINPNKIFYNKRQR